MIIGFIDYTQHSLYVFRLQPRTEILLKALVAERVDSKDLLEKIWREQPKCKNFLFFELDGFCKYFGDNCTQNCH